MNSRILIAGFSDAIRDNDEVHADRLINIACREGLDELSDRMITIYREVFGSRVEEEFDRWQEEVSLSME